MIPRVVDHARLELIVSTASYSRANIFKQQVSFVCLCVCHHIIRQDNLFRRLIWPVQENNV